MGILEKICLERREDVARNKANRPASSLERTVSEPLPAFSAKALFTIIAECKKASPSRGLLVADYDPAALALAYERGGAGAISVLTESRHFQGQDSHLAEVRRAASLPVLRKDFIVDEYQIRESWALGADAILLIAAALGKSQAAEFSACAHELGLSVLIEIHGEGELETAIAARTDAIGVNARNLRDFSMDRDMQLAIGRLLPEGGVRVAESGMRGPEDLALLYEAGYRAFLVGESLATASDPEAATRDLARTLEMAVRP